MRQAGSITGFLRRLERGVKAGTVETPCGDCRGCCSDPEFQVDITEEECKRFPSVEVYGRKVLPKNADGTCINLIDGRCSVYATRPKTCRMYDCRYHLLGARLSDDCKVMKKAVAEWEPFRLPTVEDKVAFAAIFMLVVDFAKKDPDLTGLAYLILQWKTIRPQAYDTVQSILAEKHDHAKPEPQNLPG